MDTQKANRYVLNFLDEIEREGWSGQSVKTVPVAEVDSPVIVTEESNQSTVLAVWFNVQREMSSAPS